MALAAGIAWEARADGDNTNGGGFKIGATGTDRCQQAAAHATLTTASIVHSTTTQLNVNAGDYTVSATDVGNVVFITGGSATAGRYEITVADTINNRWTVDRSLGTAGQTCPGKMGGALATPLYATSGAWWVGGNTLWIRKAAGTFSHTDTWLSGNPGTQYTGAARGNRILGYNTTRGDTPTGTDRPLIQNITNTSKISLQMQGEMIVESIRLDGGGLTGSNGVYVGAVTRFFNVYVTNNKQYGFYAVPAQALLIDCEVDTLASASTRGFELTDGKAIGCWSHDNPCSGFSLGQRAHVERCLSTNNTGAGSDGFDFAGVWTTAHHCTAHGNGRDGFRISTTNSLMAIRGCLSTGNTGYGINYSGGLFPKSPYFDYNAFRVTGGGLGETNGLSDTGGSHNDGVYTTHNVTLSADPYTNAAADDYRPNATSGGGLELWGASPFAFVDIGALQHDPDDDPSAGGVIGARIQTGY